MQNTNLICFALQSHNSCKQRALKSVQNIWNLEIKDDVSLIIIRRKVLALLESSKILQTLALEEEALLVQRSQKQCWSHHFLLMCLEKEQQSELTLEAWNLLTGK